METEDVEFVEQQQQAFQNNNNNNNNNSLDLVNCLLQQFNCLGTTDHEELVQQMLQILGHELTYSAAKFFMDMNNW